MAEVTTQIAFLGWPQASLTITYDDALIPPNPAPKQVIDFELIRFNLTCAASVEIKIWRTSGIPWREFVLPPGSYEYPAGGPVQKWSDISYVSLGTA